MRIAVVADVGPQVGLGHLGRCMALAQAIHEKLGVRGIFHVQNKSAADWIKERNFSSRPQFSGTWDLLIVDSYALKKPFYENVRPRVKKMLCLDDLGNTSWPCDWILNSNPAAAARCNYAAASAKGFLLGPSFHPMREEFWPAPRRLRISGKIKKILIVLGGGTHGQLLDRLVLLLLKLNSRLEIDVVCGPLAAETVGAFARVRCHVNPPIMRTLIESCDLAISGAGQTLFELARMGTPTIAIQMASNQKLNIEAFSSAKSCLKAGSSGASDLFKRIGMLLKKLDLSPALRRSLSEHGRQLVDGQGARRVASALAENPL